MVRIYVTLFLIVLFVACKKRQIELTQIQTPDLDASFAIPLGYVHLNIGDIEKRLDEDNFIFNNGTSAFELVFRSKVFEFGVDEMIEFPDQSFTESFGLSVPGNATFSQALVGFQVTESGNMDQVIPFNNAEELDSIVMKEGKLSIVLTSDFQHNAEVQLSIPYLIKNGNPFSATLTLDYFGSVPIVDSVVLDLSGYTFDFSKGGTTVNTIYMEYTTTLTHTGNPVNGNEQFTFDVNMHVEKIKSVWGYFGQYVNILDEDTADLDLFESLLGGVLHFEDPRLSLILHNSTGIDALVEFSGVIAPENSNVQQLGGPGLNNIPVINRALNPGEESITTHQIDNSNTSPTLSDLLDEGPSVLIYHASATTNPGGYTQNFILDTSKIWAEAEIGLPLYGYGDNFVFVDTMSVNMKSLLGENSETRIEKMTVRVIVDNGMPFEAGIQLYFTNDQYEIIDSLFQVTGVENLFEPGFVDFSLPLSHPNYGKVLSATRKITDISMTKTLVQKLIDNNSTKIIYKAAGNTSEANNQLSIKLFPEYTVDIKVSAKIDF